jgi:hypothetical protein
MWTFCLAGAWRQELQTPVDPFFCAQLLGVAALR